MRRMAIAPNLESVCEYLSSVYNEISLNVAFKSK